MYSYAGKSSDDRGSDTAESNAPAPLGVRDLQLHPPNNSHLTVAAFVAPHDGYYTVSDLAVRRVYSEGGSVTYKVFDSSQELITSLQASNNRIWVIDGNTYILGNLSADDRIYFAVDNYEGYSFDATEIAWTVTYYKEYSVVLDNPDLSVPKDFALKQNYPNPFNAHTQINYELPVDSKISLWIFDILGKKVRMLKDDFCEAGKHFVTWDGRNDKGHSVASGLYVIQMRAETKQFSKKVMLLR